MHSTPRPNSESSICCLGEINFGESPVPIIKRSIESFVTSENRDSFPTSSKFLIETSLELLAETKHGLFNLICESDIEDSSTEIMVFAFAFCCVNSINLQVYLGVGGIL